MSTKKLQRLMKLYGTGVMPLNGQRFQIWAIPSNGSWSDSYPVQGEVGDEWTEMVEVAGHFNNDGDGQLYYVGTPDALGTPLKPSWEEMRSIAQWAARDFKRGLPRHELFTLEDIMAWNLMIGGDEWEADLYTP